jgi:hypothetical protein
MVTFPKGFKGKIIHFGIMHFTNNQPASLRVKETGWTPFLQRPSNHTPFPRFHASRLLMLPGNGGQSGFWAE